MKIRAGFVSNSSSSSFMLYLEKPIQEYTKEELAKYLKTENEVAVEQIYDLCLKEEPDTEYHLVVGQDEEPPTWDAENVLLDLSETTDKAYCIYYH